LVNESKALPPNSTLEQENIDQLTDELDNLDPFTYKNSAIVNSLLQMGNEQLIDYIFSNASDCNIRAQILESNHYEFGAQIPSISLGFVPELLQFKSYSGFRLTTHYIFD
jgi:hypothetical protein